MWYNKSLYKPVHVANLVMQCQEGHRRVDGLSALGTETDHFESSLVNFFCQLVHCNVAGSTYQHRPRTQQEKKSLLGLRKLLKIY